MAVNQKQIAEKLGVSIALVSRALSGTAEQIGIKQETIKRVLETAKEMGYVPNAAAVALKGKSTRTIGVVVYDFNDPFFGALIQQVQTLAHEHNYSLILAGFLSRVPDEQDLQALHKHAIDGLIVLGTDKQASWLDTFQHLPVARIGHSQAREQSVCISIDEEDAARKLIGHLAGQGKTRLSFISGSQAVHRMRRDALERAGAAVGLRLACIESEERDPFAAGQNAARQIDIAKTDALVCATDQAAMGALHALSDAGNQVPEQLVVTGFDDIPAAVHFMPPLTTVRQPLEEMVKAAFSAIMEPLSPRSIELPGELIVRESA